MTICAVCPVCPLLAGCGPAVFFENNLLFAGGSATVSVAIRRWTGRSYVFSINLSASGNTLPILNQDKTKAIIVTRPPHAEQIAIGSFLREQDHKIESVAAKVLASIALLNEQRSTLVTLAVTGQIEGLQ